MKIAALCGAFAVAAGTLAFAAAPAEILIPGANLYTESITSAADGSIIVGTMGPGAIYRAKPGAGTAEVWIKPGTGGMASVLGVLADDKANTLWVCSFTDGPEGTRKPPSTLHAFDLGTGAPKGKWPLPTAGAICNDIAVGADGTAYVSDYRNNQVVKLAPGAKALEVWVGTGPLGPKDSGADGIAVVKERVVVNTIGTSKLFSVPIGADGKAGTAVEVKLDRPLKSPDGQRSLGEDAIIAVDEEEGGRVVRIALGGENFGSGKVTTLQAGFPDGPASVTVAGDTAYVIEAQFAAADKKKERSPSRPRL